MFEINSSIRYFCSRNNIQDDFLCSRVKAGRNSAVYVISDKNSSCILKHYFSYAGQSRSRLMAEYSFLEFLDKSGVENVASPIAMDEKNQLALYTLLPGVRPNVITSLHIEQAANFILKLDSIKQQDDPNLIDWATDSCTTVNQHIGLVDMQIRELNESCNNTEEFLEFTQWLHKVLVPAWEDIKRRIRLIDLSDAGEILTLSPSDFGFHNTLDFNGRLSFVDFEYAGWDGISKLVCDFICQPEIPISNEQARYFLKLLAEGICSNDLEYLVEALLPLHRIKWCCIMLNPFKNIERLKYTHSGIFTSDILDKQLSKARLYFSMHLN